MRENLLKEWNSRQSAIANQKIENYLGLPYSFIDRKYGLPYTSSSSFAALWVCNYNLFFDKQNHYKIRGFALDLDENLVIYCEDIHENELFVTIR